ncbi:MAG: hypothetical protein HOV77_11390 [Hamadaea sp.]|uniref:hypothetical protein n=1 Tax=Hamadaea sp. TaxID=2024425 RepID=UPI00182DFF89|nr:hypothetical protein [Hamadaea sp.]NUT19783.1 hypothetical protein [Hamadaea sp.]
MEVSTVIPCGGISGSALETDARFEKICHRAAMLALDESYGLHREHMTLRLTSTAGEARVIMEPSLADVGQLFTELPHQVVNLAAFGPPAFTARMREVGATLREILLPFSGSELAVIRRLNPSLREAARRAHRPPDSALIIIREHALLEKLNMIQSLIDGGLRADQIIFVPKPDATRYRERVIAHLRSIDCTVIDSDWTRSLTDELASRPTPDLDIVLVDDGGRLIQLVMRAQGIHARSVVAIETNSSGMKRLTEAGLTDEVVNLSDSPAKERANAWIAVSGVHGFKSYLAHRRQAGQYCHLIGYGKIGSFAAESLRASGFRVTVSEVSADRRALAERHGFAVYESAQKALRSEQHRYVFGCSGMPALTLSDLGLLAPDAVLASLSSNDFAAVIAAAAEDSGWRSWSDPSGTHLEREGARVLLLADGHAINLHGAEGVPEPDFDEFVATVIGAIDDELARIASQPKRLVC